MATEVYEATSVKLRDGKEIELIPLPIFELRKFMKRWGQFVVEVQTNDQGPAEERWNEFEVGEKQFDVFLDLLEIALADVLKGDKGDEEFQNYLGKTIDEQTAMTVFDKCGGLKLNDPNLQAAALAQMMNQTPQEDGTN